MVLFDKINFVACWEKIKFLKNTSKEHFEWVNWQKNWVEKSWKIMRTIYFVCWAQNMIENCMKKFRVGCGNVSLLIHKNCNQIWIIHLSNWNRNLNKNFIKIINTQKLQYWLKKHPIKKLKSYKPMLIIQSYNFSLWFTFFYTIKNSNITFLFQLLIIRKIFFISHFLYRKIKKNNWNY